MVKMVLNHYLLGLSKSIRFANIVLVFNYFSVNVNIFELLSYMIQIEIFIKVFTPIK